MRGFDTLDFLRSNQVELLCSIMSHQFWRVFSKKWLRMDECSRRSVSNWRQVAKIESQIYKSGYGAGTGNWYGGEFGFSKRIIERKKSVY